ncbi:MAG: hypothetical protein H7X80_09075, partial [bacterium]|nr:hypothetical protein [Candidatus Kapabacteria bacterium]
MTHINKARALYFALGAIMLSSCNAPQIQTNDVDSVAVDTTASVAPAIPVREIQARRVDFGYAAVIPYTYTNRSGDSVYLVNCNGDVSPSMEQFIEGQWKKVWQPATNGCLSRPVVIAPGASYSDTLHMGVQPHDSAFFAYLDSSR